MANKLILELELPEGVDYSEAQLTKLAYLEAQNMLHILSEIHRTIEDKSFSNKDKLDNITHIVEGFNLKLDNLTYRW